MPRGLPKEVRQRLRSVVLELQARYPEDMQQRGWQTDVAAKLGVNPSTVSRMHRLGDAGSLELVVAVAKLAGADPAEILLGVGKDGTVKPLKAVANYRESLREAKRSAELHRRDYPDWVWDKVGEVRSRPTPEFVTPTFLLELACMIYEPTTGTNPPASRVTSLKQR